jgi:pimeloyl-ACP methyl ester carboxylesterase
MRALLGAIVAVLAIGALFLALASAESFLLFPAPPRPHADPSFPSSVERTWLVDAGDRVEGFLLRPQPAAAAPAPLVIYAHGNGELIDYWLTEFAELQAHGVAVLLVEYPGYGRSGGAPSEASIQRAFVAAYDWAVAQPGIDAQRVVGYGRSLGGGAVCALARERTLAALVLESTFTSVRDVAREAFRVPGFLIRNAFDNLACVGGYGAPVLVRHGERDGVIPVAHARRLAEAVPGAELEILSCDHNDCPRAHGSIVAFLRRHGLL